MTLYLMWLAINEREEHHMYSAALLATDPPLKFLWQPAAVAANFSEELLMRRAVIRSNVKMIYEQVVNPLKKKHHKIFAGPHYSFNNFLMWWSLLHSRSFVSWELAVYMT